MGQFPGSVHVDESEFFESAKVTTTDATITVLWSKRVPTSSVMHVNAVVVGERSDGGASVVYERSAVFTRSSTGNVTLQTPQSDWATPYYESNTALTTDAAWSADATSQTGRLRVTGVAGLTYNWRCKVQVLLG